MANSIYIDATMNAIPELVGEPSFNAKTIYFKVHFTNDDIGLNFIDLDGTNYVQFDRFMDYWAIRSDGTWLLANTNSYAGLDYGENEVLVVFDSTAGHYKFYKDGVDITSGSASQIPLAVSKFRIFQDYASTSKLYTGNFYDMRLSSKELTAQEALDVSSGAITLDSVLPNADCEIAYNQFEASEGSCIVNKGNLAGSYDLPISGTTYVVTEPYTGGGSPEPPTIEIVSTTLIKISDEATKDQCVIEFKSTNVAIAEYEIRAVKSGGSVGRGMGLLVGSGTTLTQPDINITEYIDDEELTNGDGDYIITIYAKNESGDWSE